jgi:hypothetical protein
MALDGLGLRDFRMFLLAQDELGRKLWVPKVFP